MFVDVTAYCLFLEARRKKLLKGMYWKAKIFY